MSFGGGGGGSSSISSSTDVALSNPANGQVLGYNTTLGKWQNQTISSGTGQQIPDIFVYQSSGNSIAISKSGTVVSSQSTSATNNVTVIQAAIDAVATSTSTLGAGGAVLIDRGVWDLSASLNLKYGVSLYGQLGSWHDNWSGANLFGTILRPTSAVGSGATIQCGVAASGTRLATNPHGSWIMSLAIDGSNNSAGMGIYWLDCSYTRTQNVFIRNFASGIRFTGNVGQSGGPTTGSSLDNMVYDCTISACAYGIKVDGVASTDGAIRDCRIMSSTTNSINISGGGWQISGGHFTSGSAAPHLNITAGQFMCYGCYFDSGTSYLAQIYASLGTITNCLFVPSTGVTANAMVQLNFGKTTVTNNTFWLQSATNSALKGAVEVQSGEVNGLIRDNIIRNRSGNTLIPVVKPSGADFGTANTASMYVGENLQWTT